MNEELELPVTAIPRGRRRRRIGRSRSRPSLGAAEARLRKVRLRVVHAWTIGFTGIPAGGYGYMGDSRSLSGEGISELRRAARSCSTAP